MQQQHIRRNKSVILNNKQTPNQLKKIDITTTIMLTKQTTKTITHLSIVKATTTTVKKNRIGGDIDIPNKICSKNTDKNYVEKGKKTDKYTMLCYGFWAKFKA